MDMSLCAPPMPRSGRAGRAASRASCRRPARRRSSTPARKRGSRPASPSPPRRPGSQGGAAGAAAARRRPLAAAAAVAAAGSPGPPRHRPLRGSAAGQCPPARRCWTTSASGPIAEISPGPVVTLYELEPAAGTKSSRVIGLADDIARIDECTVVRVATVPGPQRHRHRAAQRRSARRSILRESVGSADYEATRPSCRWRWARTSAAIR